MALHPGNDTLCECGPVFYIFTLRINNITDLYKGGTKNPFIITDDYYSFKDKDTITKYVNYSDNDIELGLINFNQEAIVCAKSNSSLEFVNNGNNDFIYKICIVKEEGELKGLDPSNNGNNKNEGDCFYETSGVNYTLSDSEKEKNITQVKLNISVFKYCPENKIEYPYCDPLILGVKEYTFEIIINHPPLEPTEQTTTPAAPTEQATTQSHSTEQTSTQSHSTEQTTTQSHSTEQTTTQSHSTEQTTTQSHSTEQTEKSSTSDSSTNAEILDCLDNPISFYRTNFNTF